MTNFTPRFQRERDLFIQETTSSPYPQTFSGIYSSWVKPGIKPGSLVEITSNVSKIFLVLEGISTVKILRLGDPPLIGMVVAVGETTSGTYPWGLQRPTYVYSSAQTVRRQVLRILIGGDELTTLDPCMGFEDELRPENWNPDHPPMFEASPIIIPSSDFRLQDASGEPLEPGMGE